MKSRNFLRSYIQLLSIMMLMILGVIIVVFVDFGGKEKRTVSVKLASFHAAAAAEQKPVEAVDSWSFDKDVLVSVSKTAVSTYVSKGQKDVVLLHLLIQNNKNENVELGKLGFDVENKDIAENYRLFEGNNFLDGFTVSEKGEAHLDVDLLIPASEQRQLFVQADISEEAETSQKIRLKLNTAKDIVVNASAKPLNLMNEDLFAPYVGVVGK